MSTIVTRLNKGTALTYVEMDANFTNLNNDKTENVDLAASTGSTLIGYISSGTGSVATTVKKKLDDFVSVKDKGAVGDGIVNDTIAFTNADASGTDIQVPKGTYLISSSLVITNRVIFQQGAILSISTGVTVTFNGGLDAGVYQIFSCSGTGKVIINPKKRTAGYSEWWGAITNDSSADCVSAITAAFTALSKVEFMPTDYFTASTINLNLDNKSLFGAGCQYKSTGSTRIIVKSDSLPTILIGYSAQPSTFNDYLNSPRIEGIYFGRDRAPLISSNCPSVLVKFTVYAYIFNCKFDVSMRGIEFISNIKLICEQSYAFRSAAGTGSGTDYFHGFYINGNNIIGSGGNASIFINNCNASVGGLPALSIGESSGIKADAGFADVFINDFESSTCSIGINISGSTTAYGNVDLHIKNPVIDGFYKAGILISNTSESGAISIVGGYAAPSATSQNTSWALWCVGSKSQLSVVNFQGICGPSSTCGGLLVDSSKNVHTVNCSWNDSRIQSIFITGSSSIRVEDSIKHINQTTSASAVYLGGTCTRLEIDCQVNGLANGVSLGYQIVGTGISLSKFSCSGIESTAINGGSSNKLNNNGTSITTTGSFGTNNLAEGIMV